MGAGSGGSKPGSFDRIRAADTASPKHTDPQGKQALFSGAAQPPSLGSVAVVCPDCHRRTVVTLARLARLALPGVYAPVPGRGHLAYAKCPACGKRGWLNVTIGR